MFSRKSHNHWTAPTERVGLSGHNFLPCTFTHGTFFSLPAGDGDFYFGGRNVAGERVEVVHRGHVLQFVHNVALHHLHRQTSQWFGSDPRSTQPDAAGARRVTGESADQIRDQAVPGPSGWGSHCTDGQTEEDRGERREGVRTLGEEPPQREKRERTCLTVHAA